MKEKEKRTQYINERIKENYDQVKVVVPKGKKQVYKSYAETVGKSLNGLINELLESEVNKNRNTKP